MGGVGIVYFDDKTRGFADNFMEFLMTVISSKDAAEVLAYIDSTKNPVATTCLPETSTFRGIFFIKRAFLNLKKYPQGKASLSPRQII